MATHQQLIYHIVFSTKERRQLLKNDTLRDDVWRYMSGIVHNLGGTSLHIGGYYDHAHLLIKIPAKIAVSDFVRQLKANTSKHINDNIESLHGFHWQDGYGAFTVSRSQIDAVSAYIDGQLEHHRKLSFQEEYLAMLEDYKAEYDPKYLWE